MRVHRNWAGWTLYILLLPALAGCTADEWNQFWTEERAKWEEAVGDKPARSAQPVTAARPATAGYCRSCNGTGRISCMFCSGGRMRCPQCNGCGRVSGQYLKGYDPGRGPTEGGGLQFGTRIESCSRCFGQGTIQCVYCGGYGSRVCSACSGTGRR